MTKIIFLVYSTLSLFFQYLNWGYLYKLLKRIIGKQQYLSNINSKKYFFIFPNELPKKGVKIKIWTNIHKIFTPDSYRIGGDVQKYLNV